MVGLSSMMFPLAIIALARASPAGPVAQRQDPSELDGRRPFVTFTYMIGDGDPHQNFRDTQISVSSQFLRSSSIVLTVTSRQPRHVAINRAKVVLWLATRIPLNLTHRSLQPIGSAVDSTSLGSSSSTEKWQCAEVTPVTLSVYGTGPNTPL